MNKKRMLAKVIKEKVLGVIPEAVKAYNDESCFTIVIFGDENNPSVKIENSEYDGGKDELYYTIFPNTSLAESNLEPTLFNETMVELGYQLSRLVLEA